MHTLIRTTPLVLVGIFLAFPASAWVSPADCEKFSRNLKVGSVGADVRLLQQILNSSPGTQIATAGAGSPGNETDYFGNKTKLAVIKFQNAYRKEVLTPAGLSLGSGFVGGLTRAKLRAVCAGSKPVTTRPVVTRPTPATVAVAPRVDPLITRAVEAVGGEDTTTASELNSLSAFKFGPNDPLEFFYPSSYVVAPGEKIELYGRGFADADNTVRVGGATLTNVPKSLTGALSVALPASVQNGKHEVWIENGKGQSNKRFLVVRPEGTPPPMIKSYSPLSGALGTMVTVKGSGFTPTGNDVYLSNRILRDVPSPDGSTLYFTVDTPEIPGAVAGFDMPGVEKEIPFWFYVVNANGMSQNGVFHIKI